MDENRKDIDMPQTNGVDEGVPSSSDTGLSIVRGVLTALSVAVILGVSMGIFKAMKASRVPPPKKPPIPRVLKVQVEDAAVGEYAVTVEGQGTVSARHEISIIPEVMGKVVYAPPEFRDGGLIRQGDLLYRIEQDDYRAAVAQARASVSALEKEIAFQETQREATKNQLARAKDTWAITQEEAERVKRLFDQGASSEAEVNNRLASEKSNMERIEQLESSLSLIDPGIERIKSNLAAARAQLDKAEMSLARTEYRAPFTGRITGGKLEHGQFIAAGQPIAKLIEDAVFEIPVPISVSDWKALAPNATADNLGNSNVYAEVTYRDSEGRPHVWPGRVVRIGSVLDVKTRLVDVVVEIKSSTGDIPIIPGTFCVVTFTGQRLDDVVVIPRRALRQDDTVYLVEGDLKSTTVSQDDIKKVLAASKQKSILGEEYSQKFIEDFLDQAGDDYVAGIEERMKEKYNYAGEDIFTGVFGKDAGSLVKDELRKGYQKKLEKAIKKGTKPGLLDKIKNLLKAKKSPEENIQELLAGKFNEAFKDKSELILENKHLNMEVRPVKVWRHEGEDIVVLDGLGNGDQVITSVVEEVVPGMPVVVISRNGENMVPDAKAGEFGGASEGGGHH